MANPKVENGYTMVANELLDAIIRMAWSGSEIRIFWTIIRKTYGYQKKRDWISLSQIAEATGIAKTNVSREIKKLISKNVITRQGRQIGIQKDYDKWHYPEKMSFRINNLKLSKLITIEKNLPVENSVENRGKLQNDLPIVTKTDNKKFPKLITTKESNKKEYYIGDKSPVENSPDEIKIAKYTDRVIKTFTAKGEEGYYG